MSRREPVQPSQPNNSAAAVLLELNTKLPPLGHTQSTLDEFLVAAYPGDYPEKEKTVKEKKEREKKEREGQHQQTSQRAKSAPVGQRPEPEPATQALTTQSRSANNSFSGRAASLFRAIAKSIVNPSGVVETADQVITRKP